MTLDDIKNIALIVSGIVAATTFAFAFFQFRRSVALHRADQFAAMRKRREQSTTINRIAQLLEEDDPKLREISWNEKIEVLGFYEDVALMVNSGLMREHVAHYMFAYYAIRCWESDNFWHDVSRESHYWSLFRDFVERMQALENGFEFKRIRYRL